MSQIEKYSGTQFDPSCARAALEAYRRGTIHERIPEHTPTIYELIEHLNR